MSTRNVLVYSHVPLWTDHHAESLELAARHEVAGDRVYLLSCEGALASCPANPHHESQLCVRCRRQTAHSLNAILAPRVNRLTLSFDRRTFTIPRFVDISDLVAFRMNGVPFGALVASQIVDDHRDCYVDLAPLAPRVERLLEDAINLYHAARRLFVEHAINKVYVWNGRRCSDGPVAYAALSLGISVETHVWGGDENSFQTIASPMIHDLAANHSAIIGLYQSYVSEHGEETARLQASLFFEEQRRGTASYPGFLSVVDRFAPGGLPPRDMRRRIVIYTSSFWEYYALPGYAGGCYASHYEGIRALLQDERITGEHELIVRWHPNLRSCGPSERQVVERVIAGTSGCAVHLPPESSVDSYALLESADVVVTFGSTIGIEAAYYGKPSIMLGRSLYQGLGSCYEPTSHEQAVSLLQQPLPPLPRLGAIQYGLFLKRRGAHAFEYLRRATDGAWYRGLAPVLPPRQKVSERAWQALRRVPSGALRRLRKSMRLTFPQKSG